MGVGDGDGVRVGEVLLEVEEFPDWGLFFRSAFRLEWTSLDTRLGVLWMSGRLMSGTVGAGAGTGVGLGTSAVWAFGSNRPAALFLWAAICDRTLSELPPERLCESGPWRLSPATPLEPPEEWGEW